MKTTMTTISMLNLAVCIVPLLAGCAAGKAVRNDARDGYLLEYRMPKGQPMQYDLTSAFTQTMDVMGQKISLESDSRNLFTLSPAGRKNGNNQFRVVVDTAFIHIRSPRGELVPGMDGVIGPEFLYVVSPQGREVDCSGAKDLKYNMGPTEEMSLFSDFKTFFPDLPSGPIRPGEPWSNQDTLVEEGSSGYLEFITRNDHVILSPESCEGYECLKIQTTFTGTLRGEGNMQGATTATEGTISGALTWYFAYREGVLVKLTSEGKAESTTVARGEGREITIPSARDYSSTALLVVN